MRNESVDKFNLVPTTSFGNVSLSIGIAGFLAILGFIGSFPLPFTPVPFSLMPFGLMVAGFTQKPKFALLSVGLYLAAGALGAPIYADQSWGFKHLIGSTAGYLWGFFLVSGLVAWYVNGPRNLASKRALFVSFGLIISSWLAMLSIIVFQQGTGAKSFDSDLANWGWSNSSLYLLAFLAVTGAVIAFIFLRRLRQKESPLAQVFVFMLSCIILLHVCGVTVLWLATDLSLQAAIVLGSLVFLPLDLIKAALGALLSTPYLPKTIGGPRNG